LYCVFAVEEKMAPSGATTQLAFRRQNDFNPGNTSLHRVPFPRNKTDVGNFGDRSSHFAQAIMDYNPPTLGFPL
jgi:hypothetical protein